MATRMQKMKWALHSYKLKVLLIVFTLIIGVIYFLYQFNQNVEVVYSGNEVFEISSVDGSTMRKVYPLKTTYSKELVKQYGDTMKLLEMSFEYDENYVDKRVKLVIKNETGIMCTIDNYHYWLEVYENDKWLKVEDKNERPVVFQQELAGIEGLHKYGTYSLFLNEIYGDLADGTYRIVKEFNGKEIYLEFRID